MSGGNKGRCYLKTSDAGQMSAKAFTSGSIVAPPPPAPPAQLVSALATTNSSGAGPTAVFLGQYSASHIS